MSQCTTVHTEGKQVFFCENEKWSLIKIVHKQNYYTRTLSDDGGLYAHKYGGLD